jgi:hypothetical protein
VNGTSCWRIDGSPYHFAEITDDRKQARRKIHADVSAADT